MPGLLGVAVVGFGGLLMGSGGFPIKLMRKFKFEHFWFLAILIGLVILPWVITLVFCPHPFAAYSTVDPSLLVKANLCSLGWGVANLLCGLCFVRIGFALTGGILTGLGVSIGVTVPMIVKGSGMFNASPDLGSPAGRIVLLGAGIMLVGVVLTGFAGFGRDRELNKLQQRQGSFLVGLIMAIAAGILSVGMSFSFVYSQGPIVSAMKAQGAGEIPANFAVWAVALIGGALVNLLYPAYLMTKNKSWHVLGESRRELAWCLFMGLSSCSAIALLGKGMLLLGVLGASIGFGIQQAAQLLGNMGVGFIGGEWRGVRGTPRIQMYLAILVLLVAAVVMAYGNSFTKS